MRISSINLKNLAISARRWLPFLIFLVPVVIVLLLYINRTFVDTVFLDGFIFVPTIGSFLEGNVRLGDLIVRFGEHLIFGYGALSLLNAKILALDMRLDPVMFMAAYTMTAAIVYAECSRVFNHVRLIIFGILFVPLGLLCFSLVAPPGMSMTTQFAWGSAVALLIAWFLQRDFDTSKESRHRPYWPIIAILILVPIYFLIFSGAYFPGLVLGLGAMYVFRAFITGCWRDRGLVILAAVIVICALSYYYYVFVAFHLYSGQGSLWNHIAHLFTDPIDTGKYYLAGIGAGLIDLHTLERANPEIFLVLGGVMAVVSAVALWLFVRTGMYRKTYLPVYCMFYSLGVMIAVHVGRGLIGNWGWIANDWYSFHLRFFTIGVVWILLYVIYERVCRSRVGEVRLVEWRSWPVVFAISAILFVGACHAAANIAQWQRGLSVHAWMAEKRNALLFPEFYDNADAVLLWPPEDVAKCRAILEEHELSCFSPRGWADVVADSRDGILRFGWDRDDWIGRKGYAVLIAQDEATISFDGYMPEFIPKNYVEVRLNDEVIFAGDLAGGARLSFAGHLRKGRNIITVNCERAVSPSSLGINPDMRPLALHLNIQLKQAP
jgi:hypothetical protein